MAIKSFLSQGGFSVGSVGSSPIEVIDSSGNVTAQAITGTNLTLSGNLTVNGSTTVVNSTTTTIEDPVITLGGGAAGAAATSDDGKDRGIEFRWYSGSAKTGFFGFQRSSGKLTFIPTATNSSEVFSGTVGAFDLSGSLSAGSGINFNSGTGQISNAGVLSIAGTSNQITASASTGAITLSLPSAVTFPGSITTTTTATIGGNLTVSGTTSTLADISFSTPGGTYSIIKAGTGVGHDLELQTTTAGTQIKIRPTGATVATFDGDTLLTTLAGNLTVSGTTSIGSTLNFDIGNAAGTRTIQLGSTFNSGIWNIQNGVTVIGTISANGFTSNVGFRAPVGGGPTVVDFGFSGGSGFYSSTANNISIANNYGRVGNFSTTNLTLDYTTASTSTTTGALVVAGGLGIGGALYAGGVISANFPSAYLQVVNTASSNKTWQFATVGTSVYIWEAGVGSALQIAPGGNATLAGNLTVSGTGTSSVAGKLGIGTASPSAALDVWSKANAVAQFIGNAGTSAQVPAFGFYAYNDDLANAGLDIKTYRASAMTDAMRVTSGGYVGIGTTTPGTKLHVSGGAATIDSNINDGLRLSTTIGNGNNLNIRFDAPDSNGTNRRGFLMWQPQTGNTGRMSIIADSATEQFTVVGSGNVGIGNTSPSYKLDVAGAVNSTDWYYNANSGTGLYNAANTMWFSANSNQAFNISSNQTAVGLRLYSGGHTNIFRGWFYGDSTGQGFLDGSGNWQMYVDSSSRLRVYSGIYNAESGIRILNPGGAAYTTNVSTVTGAFKIRLPVDRFKSNTMMRMTVKIFQYSTGLSYEFEIGGYNYSDAPANWYNVFAEQKSDLATAPFTIRYGNDGTAHCIWIGETNSTWYYPQVFVTEFQGGYAGTSAGWASGWSITPVTTFDTVTQTRTASQVVTANNISTLISNAGNITVGGNLTVGTGATISSVNADTRALRITENGTRTLDFSVTSANTADITSNVAIRLLPSSTLAATFSSTQTTLAGNLTVSGTGTSNFATTTGFSWGTVPTAGVQVGAIGTGGSFMVQTPSLSSGYGSGLGIDGTYSGGKSVINLKAFGVQSGGPYSADLAFHTSSTTTLTEQMRLTSGGNLLLGTTTDSSNGRLQLATHTAYAGGIGFGTDVSLWRVQAGSLVVGTNTNIDASLYLVRNGGFFGQWSVDSSNNITFANNGAGSLLLRTNGTTALTLTSTQAAQFTPSVGTGAMTLSDGARGFSWDTSGGNTLTLKTTGGTAGGFSIQQAANGPMTFYTNATLALTLDSSQNATFANNVTVTGNLIVNGTTETINSTTATLKDPVITLGGGNAGTAATSDDAKDRGIEFKWYSGSAKTGFFGFQRSTGYLTFIPDGTNTSEVFSGTLGDIQIGTLRSSGAVVTNDVSANTVTAGSTYTTRITGTGSGAYISFGVSGSSALGQIGRYGSLMQFDSDSPFAFRYQGSDIVRITTGGNVGIGTTSPGYTLDVNGTTRFGPSNSGNFRLDNNATGGHYYQTETVPRLGIGRDGYSAAGYITFNLGTNSVGTNVAISSPANNVLAFYNYLTETMRVHSNNYVGIGTSSPSYKLDVNGSGRFTPPVGNDNGFFVTSAAGAYNHYFDVQLAPGGGAYNYIRFKFNGNDIFTWGESLSSFANVLSLSSPGGQGQIRLNTNGSERLRIDSSGNVGIGTTSPSYTLDVNGSAAFRNATYFIGNSTYWYNGTTYLQATNSSDVGILKMTNNSSNIALQPNGGNVGIGTTSPSYLLHVAGTGYASSDWRAPIFYDSDNTGYYVNPASTSNLHDAVVGNFTSTGQIYSNWAVTNNSSFRVQNASASGTNGAASLYQADAQPGYTTWFGTTADGTGASYQSYFGSAAVSSNQGVFITNGANGLLLHSVNNGIFFATGNTGSEKMRLTSAGNLGIGTTSPDFKTAIAADITMSGDIDASTAQLSVQGTTTPGKRMLLGYDTNGNGYGFIKAGNYGVTWTLLALQPSGGNISIGTTSNSYKLHVAGDIYASSGAIRVNSTNSFYFETYGGGWFMADTTWIRSTNDKSVWVNNGLLGSQGGLTVGYGGTTPPSGGAIIAGNVGIGTASPDAKLAFAGAVGEKISLFTTGNNYRFGLSVATAGVSSFWTRLYAPPYSDAGVQIGTVSTSDGTTFTPAISTIGTTGYVGIGNTSPNNLLEVGSTATNYPGIIIRSTAGYLPVLMFARGTGTYGITAYSNWYLANSDNGFEIGKGDSLNTSGMGRNVAIQIANSGNVGIGTTSPAVPLHVQSAASETVFRVDNTNPNNNAVILLTDNNNPTGEGTRITYRSGVGDTFFNNIYTASTNAFNFQKGAFGSGTDLLTIQNSGNVGIGTASPGYKLEVNGSFAATTKSFVIPHPTKQGKRLRYGSLEGPENGVYVRGKLKGTNVIELPEYWTKLVDPESITVNLTPIGKHQKLYVADISDNKVTIEIDGFFGGEINCFYTVFAERIDVEKLQVEVDAK